MFKMFLLLVDLATMQPQIKILIDANGEPRVFKTLEACEAVIAETKNDVELFFQMQGKILGRDYEYELKCDTGAQPV